MLKLTIIKKIYKWEKIVIWRNENINYYNKYYMNCYTKLYTNRCIITTRIKKLWESQF